jgi:hypothetical protein
MAFRHGATHIAASGAGKGTGHLHWHFPKMGVEEIEGQRHGRLAMHPPTELLDNFGGRLGIGE